jgi:hypothetical protein
VALRKGLANEEPGHKSKTWTYRISGGVHYVRKVRIGFERIHVTGIYIAYLRHAAACGNYGATQVGYLAAPQGEGNIEFLW